MVPGVYSGTENVRDSIRNVAWVADGLINTKTAKTGGGAAKTSSKAEKNGEEGLRNSHAFYSFLSKLKFKAKQRLATLLESWI